MELDNKNGEHFLTQFNSKLAQFIQTIRFSLSECELCKNNNLIHPLLCKYCYEDLPLFSYQHLHQNLLNWPAIDKLFPQRAFDKLLCLSPYVAPFDLWLKQFKYQQRFELADLFAFLLVQLWKNQPLTNDECAVMAVPIHIKKWQMRGFNQAHLIAKAFTKKSNLLYLDNALVRSSYSESQVGQSGKQRRKSLKNAFQLSETIQKLPSHIILIDDVITTGTTANTLCKLLRKKGVKHITVLTIALTLPK
jgi:ComF family protein